MKKTAVPVKCCSYSCKWRGRRVLGDCACYDEWAMSCRCAWGSCPKCGGKVFTVESLKTCTCSIGADLSDPNERDVIVVTDEKCRIHGGSVRRKKAAESTTRAHREWEEGVL